MLQADELVTDDLQLQSAVKRYMKMITSFLLNIPKAIFTKGFNFIIQAICFVSSPCFWMFKLASVRKYPAVEQKFHQNGLKRIKLEENYSEPMKTGSAVVEEEDSEPKSEDVVKNIKKIRNSVAMSITQFTGNDLFWDLPILRLKIKAYKEAVHEGNPEKIAAAKKVVLDHPDVYPMPTSKEAYDRLMEDTENGIIHPVLPTVRKSRDENGKPKGIMINRKIVSEVDNANKSVTGVSNVLEKSRKSVEFDLNNEQSSNEEKTHITRMCHRDLTITQENQLLKNKLITANNKLEELLNLSNNVLEEVSILNERFGDLFETSSKITHLQNELGEGRKKYLEVVEERNEMRSKLLALECLIKEEEDYLGDGPNESGYEEIESLYDHSMESCDEIM
jgi:hypothetical protein